MELHEYQKKAVQHLLDNPRSALFLDLGLGKSAITLSALTPQHLPALVLAPKRVCQFTWPTEVNLWREDLSISVALGTKAERQKAIQAGADITVVSRDNLGDLETTPHPEYQTIVLDELTSFKSRKSKRWRIARELTKSTAHVWGLTGTPAPNGLLDLWPQLFLIDRGERLQKTLTAYRSRYFTPGRQMPNGVVIEWKLRPEAEQNIHEKLEDICLSIDSGVLDLPDVTYNNIKVSLDSKTLKLYQEMKEKLVGHIDIVGPVHTAANAAVLSNKLTQITAGFLYSDTPGEEPTYLHNQKIEALQEVIDGTGSPVLVFYRYKQELEIIKSAINEAVSIDEPNALEHWNRREIPVLLAHPASAAHGLNLQYGGHTIVWTSMTWDLEQYLQANGRLARQGQTQPVVIHHLTALDSVDSVIIDRLAGKKSIQDALLNHLLSA